MSEPEEVILDGAHHATTAIAALWRRHLGDAAEPEVRLIDVRQRLELLTRALLGDAPPIAVAEPPSVPNWFGRLALRIPRHLVLREAVPWTDGVRVHLPRAVEATDGDDRAIGRYKVWALALSAKCLRGTCDAARGIEDPLARDLYTLGEALAVDRWIYGALPGMRKEIEDVRKHAATRRPARSLLNAVEAAVEALIRDALRADPAEGTGEVPISEDPSRTRAWAQRLASGLTAEHGRAGPREARYRGLPPVHAWGVIEPRPDRTRTRAHGTDPLSDDDDVPPSERIRSLRRRPRIRQAPDDEDDDQMGMWMVQIDDPQESVEDPMGLQRPTDRDDDADAGELADALSELPEARMVPMPGTPKEVLTSDDPPERTALAVQGETGAVGVTYPEWDHRTERYRPGHVIVRLRPARSGDPGWAEEALRQHGREVRRVRRQFERLRPHRTRLGRQPDGPDIDLGAYVTAYADRQAGHAVDDRLYEEVRPARRDLSILLLVDVSGSTDSWVADHRRIVDVEKEALLLVCEALDALGDPYSVLGFSGEGPRGVAVTTVKGFEERNGREVRARISALEPDRFTRTGAAIRHATALLGARTSRHRLLLLLSDGKPNDVDLYEGLYGIEDTRQAVAEARLEGLDAFCVTVDRHAPAYLPRIFGPTGYAVLRHATKLPSVLVDVVRLLLKS